MATRLVRDEFEPRCVGLIGLSLGAASAIPVAALEHVDAIVTMLGGGDADWVLQHSPDPRIAALRDDLTAGKELALVEPLAWAARVPFGSHLLIRARWDRTIPPLSSTALRDAIAGTQEIVVSTGHRSFALALPGAIGAAIHHVQEICSSASAAPSQVAAARSHGALQ